MLPAIAPGLGREAFMTTLRERIEGATERLVAGAQREGTNKELLISRGHSLRFGNGMGSGFPADLGHEIPLPRRLRATPTPTWTPRGGAWRGALAAPERDPNCGPGRFHEALPGFKFLPAGRVIAGAGTGRSVTLFNCFVMGTIPDDMARHLRAICAKRR